MRTWLFLSLLTASVTSAAPRSASIDLENRSRLIKAYSRLPLSFEENRGQTNNRVKFLSHGSGFGLFLTPANAVLALPTDMGTTVSMRMSLVGGNILARIVGLDELPGKSNYLIGNNPEKWHTGVPTFAKVKYEEVYPGVDLFYYGNQGELEYDFVVAPHADPRKIELEVAEDSTIRPRIDSNGDVLLKFGRGELRFRKPMMYQLSGEQRTIIHGRFVLRAGNRVGFEVGQYDSGKPLVIDPAITYSTFLSGTTGVSLSNAIATYTDPVTGHVYVYVTGTTCASDFPLVNARQAYYGGGCRFTASGDLFGGDVFVTKFDPSAAGVASVLYSTYLGGNDTDTGTGIATDSAGQLYISGFTWSTNFPTMNAYQAANKGLADAFLTKLSADGANILYSTYFGGSQDENAGPNITAVAVDSGGRAYVAGTTDSIDLPTKNPYQSAFALQGLQNAFVAIFGTTLSGEPSLLYSTYLGDSNTGTMAVAVDGAGTIHLAGVANSSNFPIVNGFQTAHGPADGGFYARLNPSAPPAFQLMYSTYLDRPSGIALDSSGNAYISTFGLSAVSLSKINPSQIGSPSLVYQYVFPINCCDIWSVAVDSSGDAFIAGDAWPTLQLVNPVQNSTSGVFQSLDAGVSWTGLTRGLSQFPISALAVDTSTSLRTLYAGSSANSSANTNGGVFASADGGVNWNLVLQLPQVPADPNDPNACHPWSGSTCVLALAVDPTTPSNVYAGTSGGLYKSSDRGATWSGLNSGLSTTSPAVHALLFDNGVLYAGMSDGLYKLAAGATAWTPLTLRDRVTNIAVDPTTTPHTFYADSPGSNFDSCNAYKSTDNGITWTNLRRGYLAAIAVDTTTRPTTLYGESLFNCGDIDAVVFSVDGGNTWAYSAFNVADDASTKILIDTSHAPSVVYLLHSLDNPGGLFRSSDAMDTSANTSTDLGWSSIGAIALDLSTGTPSSPATLYAATGNLLFGPLNKFPEAPLDAFVAELDPTGSNLLFSTYIGGIKGRSVGSAIALDNTGNIYVTGRTYSQQFQSVNAYLPTKTSGSDTPFFTKLGNQSLPPSSPNSVATQVGVQTGTLTITLPNITGSITNAQPTLTVAPLSSASTANFSLSNNLGAYDISTTATFAASTSNPVTLCFQATAVNDLSTFGGLEIMHIVNGVPQNVTTTHDFTTRTICGAVTSLSPFVLVKGPVGQLNDLVRMVTESDVKHGIQTSLDAKLQAATSALSDAKTNANSTACNVLGAFISDVQAQTGKSITQQEANTFVSAARQVKATIGCSQ